MTFNGTSGDFVLHGGRLILNFEPASNNSAPFSSGIVGVLVVMGAIAIRRRDP